MKVARFTYLLLFFVGCWIPAFGQLVTPGVDSIRIDSTVLVPVDTVVQQQAQEENQTQKVSFTVQPWDFHKPLNADITADDSTLRWQIWPDWTYRLNRKPGVISYRMGTGLRTNAVQRYAHEPRYQQLYWEGISLNDPVSGALNWKLIPQHKIRYVYGEELGTQYRTSYNLRQYYLTKPLSRLIYSESKFTHRNLEFEVSHNLSRRTNVEVSYWDRRTGGEYPNSEVSGRQIYAKLSHHLSERQYLKLNYINNNYDVGRPFGYAIADLANYNFDRYEAVANSSSSRSQEKSSLLSLNYYQRKADSTITTDNFRAGIFYRGVERLLSQTTDTTGYSLKAAGATVTKWLDLGGLSLEGRGNFYQFFNTGNNLSLPASDWSLVESEGKARIDLLSFFNLEGSAGFNWRSDDFQDYRFNVSSEIKVGGLSLSAGASKGTIMPTQQQLYWESGSYSGNPSLRNEKIKEARGELSFTFGGDSKIGVRGQHKDISGAIMVQDSSFVNITDYASQSAAAFFDLDLRHFEFTGSATVQRFTNSYTGSGGPVPMDPAKRVWLKGGAYWKGYLFDRATYVKAGLSGMMAPFRYQADHYNPELNTWQSISNDQRLPIYNRLDVDISARVRSIMFVLRWENVLDDVNQLGYFETAGYPMSQRRFIFGVRALFRN